MKNKFIILIVLLLPFVCFSQEVILNKIEILGGTSITHQNNLLLSENTLGPIKVEFLGGVEMVRQEQGQSKEKNEDRLKILFSGRIHSEMVVEPFIFTNKTTEELIQLQILIFPNHLQQPYDLYLDLEMSVTSKQIGEKNSSDAGEYNSILRVNLTKI